MTAERPAVSIRRVHAEPESDQPGLRADQVGWLALSEDGTVRYYPSARALVRAVRRRDRRDAARGEKRGAAGTIIATVITWTRIPPGFVPPTEELS